MIARSCSDPDCHYCRALQRDEFRLHRCREFPSLEQGQCVLVDGHDGPHVHRADFCIGCHMCGDSVSYEKWDKHHAEHLDGPRPILHVDDVVARNANLTRERVLELRHHDIMRTLERLRELGAGGDAESAIGSNQQ